MKSKITLFIVLLTLYSVISFAAMIVENSTNSFVIRQNKKLDQIEIQAKDGRWQVASKEYFGENDDFRSRISLKIERGKVYLLSISGDEITFFNAGLHPAVTSIFDLVLEWKNNYLYIWGERIEGRDKTTNCERIMITYERMICSDMNYRIFRAIVNLRSFANKIQLKDVRAIECDTCWCHVRHLNDGDSTER
jgi:hypothetical protein